MATPIRRVSTLETQSSDARRVGDHVRDRIVESVEGLNPDLLSIDAQTRSDHFAVYVFVAQLPLVRTVENLADALEAELREEGYPTSLFVRTWTMSGV